MRWVKIFDGNVARARIQENKPQLLIVENKRICLIRTQNKFYAISNACTHNGESLSKGKINFAGEIVCPWHGYQFNLKTGREYQERSADLETFPVRDEGDGMYIAI